jgi:hypothetical protein
MTSSVVDTPFIANCDRRLSRAARSFVARKTYFILSHHYHFSVNDPNIPSTMHDKSLSLSPAMKMRFYKSALDALMTHPNKCILNMNSDKDIFWNIDYHSTYHKLRYSKVKRRHVYTCPICQKHFISLFYLDAHITNHHIDDLMLNTTQMTYVICPAQDICSILGRSTCHIEALKNEPYYARGDLIDFANMDSEFQSSGISNVKYDVSLAKATKRNYQRQIMDMPCSEQDLAESREQCLKAMEDCFGGDNHQFKEQNGNNVLHDMQRILCEVKSCQDYFSDILGDSRKMYDESSLHLLKHSWEHHMDHIYFHDMRSGFGFVFLVILLGFYMAIVNGWYCCTITGCDRWFIKKRRRAFDHNRRHGMKID